MKKIVFVTLPLKNDMKKCIYPVDGNVLIEVKEPIYYAANSILANTMKAEDEIKVFLLETKGGENAGEENAKLFKEELDHFNQNIGAKINYETLSNAFDPSKTNFQFMFKALIKELEQGAEIYADVTFGPKPLAFLLFTVLQFAEKFFDCSIGNIVYSKVEFRKGEIIPGSEMIYDITPLYLMNSFTNMIESTSSECAIKAVEALFEE
jgi:hypothetical protein